jgi:hypothetical protein
MQKGPGSDGRLSSSQDDSGCRHRRIVRLGGSLRRRGDEHGVLFLVRSRRRCRLARRGWLRVLRSVIALIVSIPPGVADRVASTLGDRKRGHNALDVDDS